jgi:pyruvate carboxylase
MTTTMNTGWNPNPGVELLIVFEAISEADELGMRAVMCILNGQLRRDRRQSVGRRDMLDLRSSRLLEHPGPPRTKHGLQ